MHLEITLKEIMDYGSHNPYGTHVNSVWDE